MHAVNGHKLFRYRVRHPEVMFGGPWNAADALAFTDASEVLVDPFPGQAPPVAMHSNLQGGVRDDRGCPVDSVDLRVPPPFFIAVSSKRIEQREMSQPVPHNSTRPFTGDTIHRVTEKIK